MPDDFPIIFIRTVLTPFGFALLVSILVFGLQTISFRRLPRDVHWSVAARSYWPLRITATLAPIWIACITVVRTWHTPDGRDFPWLTVLAGVAAMIGVWFGLSLASRGMVLPAAARRGSIRSKATLAIIFPSGVSVAIVMACTFHHGLSTQSLMVATAILALNIFMFMGGAVILLKLLGLARPVEDVAVISMVRDMAARRGLAIRHVMIIDLKMANAFAFPWTKDIAFTPATLETLDAGELRSIASHEIAHLQENIAIRLLRLASLPGTVLIGLAPAAIHSEMPALALLFVVLHFIINWTATRFQRLLEVRADTHAGADEGEAGTYARALEKIHAASLIPAVMGAGQIHPDLYDRMLDARVTPDFPRPRPPLRLLPIFASMAAAMLFHFAMVSFGERIGPPRHSPLPVEAGQGN